MSASLTWNLFVSLVVSFAKVPYFIPLRVSLWGLSRETNAAWYAQRQLKRSETKRHLTSGAGGRRFKSSRPDHSYQTLRPLHWGWLLCFRSRSGAKFGLRLSRRFPQILNCFLTYVECYNVTVKVIYAQLTPIRILLCCV